MTARDGGSRSDGPIPTPGISFARRHPILTGFGVLAGLSLFAAYFPVSAIVTGVVVGAHATGADRTALRLFRRAATAVTQRWRVRHPSAPPPAATGEPHPDAPAVELRGSRGVHGAGVHTPAQRRVAPRRAPHVRRPEPSLRGSEPREMGGP